MQIPAHQSLETEFDERNLWLQAMLGIVSMGERLEAALTPGDAGDPVPSNDLLVDACLGVLALRAKVNEVLEFAARGEQQTEKLETEAATADSGSLREVLR